MEQSIETRQDPCGALLERALLRGAGRRLADDFDRRCRRRTMLLAALLLLALGTLGTAAHLVAHAAPEGPAAADITAAEGNRLAIQSLASL